MGAGYGSQFSRHAAKVGDLTVQYLKGGHGEPLLYLHGLGGWGKWESYHLTMGITNLVYAPQLPGWQMGKIPPEVTSVRDYARIMVQFLDIMELEKVDLVGHSIGGWVALYLAVDHPARVSRLVVADTLGLAVPEAPAVNLADIDEEAFLSAAFAQTGVVLIADDFGGVLEDIRTGPEFKRQWKGRELVAKLTGGQPADPELTAKVTAITAETLIVWGREDGIVPWRQGERLAQAIPHAKFAAIAGAGHTPMREKRDSFQRLLHDFLLGQDGDFERDAAVRGEQGGNSKRWERQEAGGRP
jgi:pimeloyl-ACP methyl ester carboxylesterase